MGDRAMGMNGACVNPVDGSSNIVGGADSYRSVRAALLWGPPMQCCRGPLLFSGPWTAVKPK